MTRVFDPTITLGVLIHLLVMLFFFGRWVASVRADIDAVRLTTDTALEKVRASLDSKIDRLHAENQVSIGRVTADVERVADKVDDLWEDYKLHRNGRTTP